MLWRLSLFILSIGITLTISAIAEDSGAPGSLKWRYLDNNTPHSSPSIGPDGTIYFGSDKSLYALNAKGQLKWEFKTNGIVATPSIGPDGSIYAGSTGLYAFYPDGVLRWNYITGNYEFQTPAIASSGTIYFPSTNGKLYALNPNGSLRWSYKIGFRPSSPAIDYDGTIYVCGDNNTYAINPNGSLKWSFSTGPALSHLNPTIGPDNITYIASHYNGLYALNSNGTLKWHNSAIKVSSSPTIGPDGTIYVGVRLGYIYALNPNGSIKWHRLMNGSMLFPPTIGSNGVAYAVADSDSYLYAIDSNGSLQWQYQIKSDAYSSPTLDSDGTMYVGSEDKYLYALYTSSKPANSTWSMLQRDMRHTGNIRGTSRLGSINPASRISGTIYYNKVAATNYSNASAVIWLVNSSNGRNVPIDYRYNNQTGKYVIYDVPPGNYKPFVRLESGYPFDAESAGDFISLNDTNHNISVPSNSEEIQNDLFVIYSIHLIKPVDNQKPRILKSDPPEALNQSKLKVFEWEPVPAAKYYKIQFNLNGDEVISEFVNKKEFSPNLQITPSDRYYEFSVEAYSKDDELIGIFHDYYLDGFGDRLKFKFFPAKMINGTIYYNKEIATNYSNAPAVIWLVNSSNGQNVPIDFMYNNQTGKFVIYDVPPGNYILFVRLESGYPFDAESAGDFDNLLNSTNLSITASQGSEEIQKDLFVTYSIHLIKPIDNQQPRILKSDPPEALNETASKVFEWEPVPAAKYYRVQFNLSDDKGMSGLANKTEYSPSLQITRDSRYYEFNIRAYNKDNEPIGAFHEYFLDGNANMLKFNIFPDASPPAPKAIGQPFWIEKEAVKANVAYSHPRVAFDGTNYLVVWSEQRHPMVKQEYDHRLRGARISPAGVILDPGGFVITSDYGKYNNFDIAFDGTNYLVVWEREMDYSPSGYLNVDPTRIVAAARVSKDGKVLDATPIIIDNDKSTTWNRMEHTAPQVAFTGTDFLIVYINANNAVYNPGTISAQDGVFARFVSPSGTLSPQKIKLLSISPTFVAYRGMDIAFNPALGEGVLALMAYDESKYPADYYIQGLWLKLQGSTLTASTPIAIQKISDSMKQFDHPAICTDGSGNYLLAYEDRTAKSTNWPDISGAILEGKTKKVNYLGAIVKGINEEIPSITFDGKSYLVAYSHSVQTSSGCGFVYLGATGVSPQGDIGPSTYCNTWANLAVSSAVASGASNCLAVFEEEDPNSATTLNGVAGQFLEKTP